MLVGHRIRDHVNIDEELPQAYKTAVPTCGTPKEFSMNLFAHLAIDVAKFDIPPELALGRATWNALELGDTLAGQNTEMGARIALGLERNDSSWGLYNLAAVYWRVRGRASDAIDCLRCALSVSPVGVRDVALLQLANVLANAGSLDDALRITSLVLAVSERPHYAAHYLQSRILLARGDAPRALEHLAKAAALQPELKAARELYRHVAHKIKAVAAPARRMYEINIRTMTMVLPRGQAWSDFKYAPRCLQYYGLHL